jgi:hypothetical protein
MENGSKERVLDLLEFGSIYGPGLTGLIKAFFLEF